MKNWENILFNEYRQQFLLYRLQMSFQTVKIIYKLLPLPFLADIMFYQLLCGLWVVAKNINVIMQQQLQHYRYLLYWSWSLQGSHFLFTDNFLAHYSRWYFHLKTKQLTNVVTYMFTLDPKCTSIVNVKSCVSLASAINKCSFGISMKRSIIAGFNLWIVSLRDKNRSS